MAREEQELSWMSGSVLQKSQYVSWISAPALHVQLCKHIQTMWSYQNIPYNQVYPEFLGANHREKCAIAASSCSNKPQ
jgi:hypothetical protein